MQSIDDNADQYEPTDHTPAGTVSNRTGIVRDKYVGKATGLCA